MPTPPADRWLPITQSALRLVAASAYTVHGAQKALGWFGGFGPDGAAAVLRSRWGVAGAIEIVVGVLLLAGYRTRWAAFIASGEMAVAYFWIHAAGSGSLWWWVNRGELPLLNCFIFAAIAAWGAGPLSVDAWLASRGRASGGASWLGQARTP
jgi:putative oxidoreductase